MGLFLEPFLMFRTLLYGTVLYMLHLILEYADCGHLVHRRLFHDGGTEG